MSRKPRKKIKDIITSDTIYFDDPQIDSISKEVFSSHQEIYQSWLDGKSIWQICDRFNIRVKEAEELVRHGVLLNIRSLKKRAIKTGRKSSKKKQQST